MRLINSTRNVVLAESVEIAASWPARLRGLMFRREMPAKHCLLLHPCNGIHTFFMKFDIDVLFLDKAGIVVHLISGMVPGRVSAVVKGGIYVAELPAGTITETGTVLDDRVNIPELQQVFKGPPGGLR